MNDSTCVIAVWNSGNLFLDARAREQNVATSMEDLLLCITIYFLVYCAIESGGCRWCALFHVISTRTRWILGFAFGRRLHTRLVCRQRVEHPRSICRCSNWVFPYSQSWQVFSMTIFMVYLELEVIQLWFQIILFWVPARITRVT